MIGMSVDMVGCELLQVPADVQRGVGAEGAGEDSDQGEPADKGVAGGPHYFGDQRAVGGHVTGPNGWPAGV